MFLIGVKGIKVKAPLGVYDWEKQQGRDFEIDVEFNLNLIEDQFGDELTYTVNYEQVVSIVVGTMMKGGNLLEAKVGEIGKNLFGQFPQLKELKVRINKLNPMGDDQVEKSFVERIFKQPE